jgi:hypothetical protein
MRTLNAEAKTAVVPEQVSKPAMLFALIPHVWTCSIRQNSDTRDQLTLAEGRTVGRGSSSGPRGEASAPGRYRIDDCDRLPGAAKSTFTRAGNAHRRRDDGNVDRKADCELNRSNSLDKCSREVGRSDFWIAPQGGLAWDKVPLGIIGISVIFSQFSGNVLRNDAFNRGEGIRHLRAVFSEDPRTGGFHPPLCHECVKSSTS